MRQLYLIDHGEPWDVVELRTVSEPALGQDDVLVSMEAAPLDPSDFLLVRGVYGVRPGLPFPLVRRGRRPRRPNGPERRRGLCWASGC